MGIQKGFLMIEQPNTQEQTPQSRQLVLPAYPGEKQGVNIGQQPPAGPSQYTQFGTTPTFTDISNSFQKLGHFWHKDAAYKVLIIAVAGVVLSGILFMALSTASLLQGLGFISQNVTVRGTKNVIATVVAVAKDQNGQRVISQPVQVMVNTSSFGG